MNCITKAQHNDVKIIISHHDFKSTPEVEEMFVTYEKNGRVRCEYWQVSRDATK